MKKPHLLLLTLTTAILFVVLFYKKSLGINLLLFEAVIIPAMLYINRPVRFIYKLSNATLPYTTKTLEQLSDINAVQIRTMPFDISQSYLWSYQEYYERINKKKDDFLNSYNSRSILEWNLPDYLAFKRLKAQFYELPQRREDAK